MAELVGTIVGGIIWGHVFARVLVWARITSPAFVAILSALIVVVLCRFGFDYLAPIHFLMAAIAGGNAFFTARRRASSEQN